MNEELSVLSLILDAGLVVQLVMVLLLMATLTSWTLIFVKRGMLARTRKSADQFDKIFWSGGKLNDIYDAVKRRKDSEIGVAGLFRAGYDEFMRLRGEDHLAPDDILASVQRAMRVARARELDRLDRGLAFLATVGSTSPYVGLFGTVWGIMNAFIGLGGTKHATMDMVAPGIAEALIATAMGLIAAIPAVIAYNTFSSRVERLESRYDSFSEELIGIVQRGVKRSAHQRSAQPAAPVEDHLEAL